MYRIRFNPIRWPGWLNQTETLTRTGGGPSLSPTMIFSKQRIFLEGKIKIQLFYPQSSTSEPHHTAMALSTTSIRAWHLSICRFLPYPSYSRSPQLLISLILMHKFCVSDKNRLFLPNACQIHWITIHPSMNKASFILINRDYERWSSKLYTNQRVSEEKAVTIKVNLSY